MTQSRYTVRVSKDYLVFCCAHFITYDGDQCERLHGHNYRASVELSGPLDENHYVFDFVTLKGHMRAIVDELDHHVLLATRNPLLPVTEEAGRVRVTHGGDEWAFPRKDCVLLPIENTTAELLAKWAGERLLTLLREKHGFHPRALRVEVEETFGQWAAWEWAT